MKLLPEQLHIPFPTPLPEQRGRSATTSPLGMSTSVRCTREEFDEIDFAIKRVNALMPNRHMSRNSFIRAVIVASARYISNHLDAVAAEAKELQNGV